MKKTLFIFTTILFFALALTSCKKDEANNNGNSNGNTENPGGGGSGGSTGGGNYNNQEYPSTANVIRRAVTDIDGNCYDAVQIGNQVWMAENLRTTRFADGTAIPMGSNSTYSSTEPYRYAPGSNQSNEENMVNVSQYGYLYNWSAVMCGNANNICHNPPFPTGVQGVCPNGWHVPSIEEWQQLISYVKTQDTYFCSYSSDNIAKALAATWGWSSTHEIGHSGCEPGYEPSTNNATGFSAVPAGHLVDGYGITGAGSIAHFWSSSVNYGIGICEVRLYTNWVGVPTPNIGGRDDGYSVRCIRN